MGGKSDRPINELEFIKGEIYANRLAPEELPEFHRRVDHVLSWIDLFGPVACRPEYDPNRF